MRRVKRPAFLAVSGAAFGVSVLLATSCAGGTATQHPAAAAAAGGGTGAGVRTPSGGRSPSSPPSSRASASAAPTSTAEPLAVTNATQQLPGGLTDMQLAGERIIYSYTGLTPPTSLLNLIRAGEAGGVIFFADNITGAAQINRVIQELDQANAQSPVKAPLLLMTDQEGGEVRRLPGAPALSEKDVGRSAAPQTQASWAGTSGGENLAGVGMDVDLAPVLDVYYRSGDFDDKYQRSYSNDPATVGGLGEAFITSLQARGVAATAKHFPGLGSASATQNTDDAPVTLPLSLAQLRGTDEVPYQSAIAHGVKLIMVSWAVYPALDSSRPAGMSPAVVEQELRGRLGFTGVTITDALEAGALNSYGSTGQRTLDAANAGMDLILCSSGQVGQGEDAMTALADALGDGQLNTYAFTQAADRVSALRSSLP